MSLTSVRFGSPARRPLPRTPFLIARAARHRSLFFGAPVLTVLTLCGCHSSSESARQTQAESISSATRDDTALLASGSGGLASGVITKANDAAGPGSGAPPAVQSAATTSAGSRWANLFGRKETPDRVVLPRNDQAAENGAADGAPDKTAANEF